MNARRKLYGESSQQYLRLRDARGARNLVPLFRFLRTFDEKEISFGIFRQYTKCLYSHFSQRRVAASVRVPVDVEVHVGIGKQT